MPRLARLDAAGVLHHIMIREIEGRKIFRNRNDYYDFMERLAMLLPEMKTSCYAWVLMPNHAHFLFCTGTVPLARLMRRLLTGYAVSFNRRHKRLLCYWAVREAGISLRTLAKRLRMSAPGIGYAVERGETIVQESHYELIQ
jgi:REP element-mobilizing transposase RayT